MNSSWADQLMPSYVGAKEIWEYFNSLAEKFDLNKYIKLQHKVVHAAWDEEKGVWQIEVLNEATGMKFTDWCHFFINGSGFLKYVCPFLSSLMNSNSLTTHSNSHWRWPNIPGLDSFKGAKLHSAAWDDSVVLKGKRVAVIGNGSSGIQIVTAIQPCKS